MHGTILGNCCLSLIFVIENSVKKPAQCVRVHLKWIAVFLATLQQLHSAMKDIDKFNPSLTEVTDFFLPRVCSRSVLFQRMYDYGSQLFSFCIQPQTRLQRRKETADGSTIPSGRSGHQRDLIMSTIRKQKKSLIRFKGKSMIPPWGEYLFSFAP